jgi:hypothetical protein
MSHDKPKIFDDFPTVDCNGCELYWVNACDGVKKAQERPCTAFKATRGVVIPLQIKSLQRALKRLVGALVILGVIQILTLILILLGRI